MERFLKICRRAYEYGGCSFFGSLAVFFGCKLFGIEINDTWQFAIDVNFSVGLVLFGGPAAAKLFIFFVRNASFFDWLIISSIFDW